MTDIQNLTKANRKKVLKLAARLTAMYQLSIKTGDAILDECNEELYTEFAKFANGLTPKPTLAENAKTALLHYYPNALTDVKQTDLFQ